MLLLGGAVVMTDALLLVLVLGVTVLALGVDAAALLQVMFHRCR